MQLGSTDHILTQQALIVGQVLDILTERPLLYPPTIALLYQTPAGEPERPYPLKARTYRNGNFVFFGDPATAFPRLRAGGSLNLLLRVSAPRYQSQEIALNLSSVDLTPTEKTIEIDGHASMLLLLNVPLFEQSINLEPEPLCLKGRTVKADDPDVPVVNATITIVKPSRIGPLKTNSEGYFTFNSLPVVSQIRLQARRSGFVPLDTVVTLDYRQPVNRMTLALTRS